jgi:hypothetical protein
MVAVFRVISISPNLQISRRAGLIEEFVEIPPVRSNAFLVTQESGADGSNGNDIGSSENGVKLRGPIPFSFAYKLGKTPLMIWVQLLWL